VQVGRQGPGGARLQGDRRTESDGSALEIGSEVLDEFEDGVWFADLTSTSRQELIPRVIAGALGVLEVQDAPIQETLIGYLRRKRLVLILDDCEHLIESCAEVPERLLNSCPDLHILSTSREPLRVPGERRWRVQPLAVPALDGPSVFDAVSRSAAPRLFVERARAIDPEFELTEANALPVAQICTRLDGIPLAIELAASRIGILSPAQIASRLADSFRLLAGGPRAAPSRLRTMEAALALSYNLLSERGHAAP
jgi:predicted ATPase